MLKKFRNCYPQGSLVGELIDIDRGLYIVKVSVQVEGIILATGLAAADKVETAEDRARERALAALTLETNSTVPSQTKSVPTPKQTATKNGSETNNHSNVVNLSVPPAPTPSPAPNTMQRSLQGEGLHQKAIESPAPPVVEPEPTPEPAPVNHPVENQTVFDTATDNSGNLFAGTYDNQETETATVPLESEENSAMPPVDSTVPNTTLEMDFNAIKHQTDIELKRLGWTRDDGRNFLQRTYGKRSRLSLTDEQLLEFLQYLQNEPTPE